MPAGTPAPITARLSAEIQRIVALPEVAQRIRSMEYEPVGSSSEAFARFIEKDAAQWAAVVKKGNIVLD